MKLSLCVICGQEEAYVDRFLSLFAKDFDELCLVRAIGNQEHDRTVSLAKAWCEANRKEFKFAEYRNQGWRQECLSLPVSDENPATWRHVDDFAAARNVAWSMASHEWQFWADFDDMLSPDSAGLIRECAESEKAAYYFFTYGIKVGNQTVMRERLFRVGESVWNQPIHENCRIHNQAAKWVHDERVIYSHEPDDKKQRDPERNRRIAEYHLRYLNAFAPEIQREWFWKWQAEKDEKKKAEYLGRANHWANVSKECSILLEQKCALLLNMSVAAAGVNISRAIDYGWEAARLMPWSREPWGTLAEHYLEAGDPGMADFMATLMQWMRRPPPTGMPIARRFYEDYGFYLRMRTLRASGQSEKASKEELGMFQKHGNKCSLLHATRGRPQQALETRDNFLKAALNPLGVEHIFAIDADDAESIEALKLYRHVIVENPRGCVKAWNAAAAYSTGDVLIQLSDDWIPCIHWDELIYLALWDGAKKRNGLGVRTTPLVLAIDDGHRRDQLLCMAICTRARYEKQGHLFAPEYFGVFSDNEFSLRAFRDGIVVEARHLVFVHQHPIFDGKPFQEWDPTHQRQNAPERYAEGQAIFERRNGAVRIS